MEGEKKKDMERGQARKGGCEGGWEKQNEGEKEERGRRKKKSCSA